MGLTMAKTARAAIEDLLTCESCHAFYYVERAEDGARTRLRCTSCGHSRDVLLSGAKTNKWTVIDPNGDLKTFTDWDDLVRTMSGSQVTAVRAKLASDRPVSDRATSERPPVADPAPVEAVSEAAVEARAPSNRPGSNRPAVEPPAIPPMHEVQPIGPSVGPEAVSAATSGESSEEAEEKPKSMSGAALLDVTPTPMAPALSLDDSAPAIAPAESDKSIDIAMSEPHLPSAPESKPEALVEALVSAMPEASAPPAATVEKTADVAPVAAKPPGEPWDDDEAEVLSMRDIQVVPVAEGSASPPDTDDDSAGDLKESSPLLAIGSPEIREKDKDRESRSSSTPPPPARGALKTLPPPRPGAPPPPTITFEEAKKSDPPPTVAKKSSDAPAKSESEKPKPKAKSDGPKKSPEVRVKDIDKDEESRTANTVPPKSRNGAAAAKSSVATAKAAQVDKAEEGGRSWLLPALGVAAAAGVVWYLANGQSNNPQTQTPSNPTATMTAAPTNTTASTEKPVDPSTTTTTTTATASASAPAPIEKAATPNVKPVESAHAAHPTTTGEPTTTTTTTAKPNPANMSMSEALDKAGQARRSGDFANAKELYARVLKDSPTNVEAHSGLGDIAKAQGDLAAAKASYQKALASSPDYGPALLSLADTEWDMGDRAAAQARYAKIVAARGGSAPARAKERAGTE
jgi:predicted Zn finger-like uncharacterized protein